MALLALTFAVGTTLKTRQIGGFLFVGRMLASVAFACIRRLGGALGIAATAHVLLSWLASGFLTAGAFAALFTGLGVLLTGSTLIGHDLLLGAVLG
jgi:hypothetical protein